MALKIQLTKSFAGASDTQMRTIRGLGLKKFGQVRILKDTPANRGMVFKVKHLVTSETVSGEAKVKPRRKPRHVRVREAARAKADAPAGK